MKIRTEAERENSNLKDDYGGRYVRLRGAQIVMSFKKGPRPDTTLTKESGHS